MHASATGNGRWIGILAVAAAVAAGSVAAGASGVGEREQSEREAHDGAAQEHETLFISGIGDSYIGVGLREVEDSGTLTVKEGAVVARVIDGSAAAAAGIEVGDIIIEFDGQRIRGTRQLRRVVQETPARRTVAASLLRDGARITVQVTPRDWQRVEISEPDDLPAWGKDLAVLEELPDLVERAFMLVAGRARLGIRAESVDGQLADFFGVSAGVLVRHVGEDTVAADAGLRAGDVITAIDGEAVDDLSALRRRFSALDPGAAFDIAIVRDRAEMSLPAELGDEARRSRGPRPGTGI